MSGERELTAWIALTSIETVKSIRDGGMRFTEESSVLKGDAFEMICSGLQIAHEIVVKGGFRRASDREMVSRS